MSEHTIRWGRPSPWLAAIGGLGAFVGVVGSMIGVFEVPADEVLLDIFLIAAVVAWGNAGAMIGRRRPENPIGLLLSTEAFLIGVLSVVDAAAKADPGSALAAFNADAQGLLVPLLLMAPFILLLFPDGKPPSRRWNVVIGLFALSVVTGLIGMGLAPGLAPERSIPWSTTASTLTRIAAVSGLLASILAIVSVILRFRRSRGVERAQMRWLAIVGILGFLGLIGAIVGAVAFGETSLVNAAGFTLFILSLAIGLPAAIGVSVLRYRLWELDVVVKKTVVALVLTLAFGVPVLAILAIASQVLVWGVPDPVYTLVGGVALGILVVPIIRLARRIATRITFGRRASGYEVLTAFGERVGETYSVVDVLPRMVRVLANATGATSARVLLRVGAELREEASMGEPVGDEHAVPVLYEGEDLGAIAATFPPSDPIDPPKRQLMENLAGQAGLVLRNVRLIEELRASRQRLVAAQDEQRRKLERDLHDGAQQQLVALTVQLRLAQGFVTRDPPKAESMLTELQTQTQTALDDLRDLARGIYPPLLADRGLAVAVEAQARKASVPTTVSSDGVGRYPREVEAAVYFSCLEALNNVAKYAQASSATISLSQANGTLTFAVTDDGVGFDVAGSSHGTGLQGMADRLDAIGGAVHVRSAPGGGTTVTGTVPTKEATQ
ncbi:MAG: histidine kinase [Actinomycetota bacterium]